MKKEDNLLIKILRNKNNNQNIPEHTKFDFDYETNNKMD